MGTREDPPCGWTGADDPGECPNCGAGIDLVQRCRVCGCSEMAACGGGCYWIEPDLCNRCGPRPVSDIPVDASDFLPPGHTNGGEDVPF